MRLLGAVIECAAGALPDKSHANAVEARVLHELCILLSHVCMFTGMALGSPSCILVGEKRGRERRRRKGEPEKKRERERERENERASMYVFCVRVPKYASILAGLLVLQSRVQHNVGATEAAQTSTMHGILEALPSLIG